MAKPIEINAYEAQAAKWRNISAMGQSHRSELARMLIDNALSFGEGNHAKGVMGGVVLKSYNHSPS